MSSAGKRQDNSVKWNVLVDELAVERNRYKSKSFSNEVSVIFVWHKKWLWIQSETKGWRAARWLCFRVWQTAWHLGMEDGWFFWPHYLDKLTTWILHIIVLQSTIIQLPGRWLKGVSYVQLQHTFYYLFFHELIIQNLQNLW